MEKLKGKICLIAGGTGAVGECLTKVFLKEGAQVIVPSRSQDKLDALREYLGPLSEARLELILDHIGEPQGAERIRDRVLSRFSRLDAVVASLGGTWQEALPLVKVAMDTFVKYQESNFNAHLITAKTFLPILCQQPGSSYTLLGGISAVMPVPLYSPVSINSAAQLMMAKILMAEMKGSAVRINQVMYGYINTRARAAHSKPEWVTADEVATFLAYLASEEARGLGGGILQFGDRPPPTS